MDDADYVEIYVYVVAETDMAVLIRDDKDCEHWLPKSQISWAYGNVGEDCDLEVAEWLALERGLI